MEIFYTEITQDLTANLLEIAQEEMAKKHKVFYIVPSSMSFEKEKEILERINGGADAAVFDLLVTRFKQFPYYFDKNDQTSTQVELSSAGMAMLFRKVMKNFSKEEIPLYFGLQNSANFFEMLVSLRNELEKSNLVIDDLPDNEKNRELKLIFNQFEADLSAHFANFSSFSDFIEEANAGKFDEQLKNVVCIVDGYTRFSAEEEKFIACFSQKVDRFIIGTFSEKVTNNQRVEDSVYANALQMIDKFSLKYQAKVKQINDGVVNNVYSKLTELIKQDQAFIMTDQPLVITDSEKKQFSIWEAENQTAEIEAVAKRIRQKLVEGARFKDFTILVGHSKQYEIPVKQIFQLYDIPYFYAEEEKMSHHPLIVFLESLFAVKKNNYRATDVINLLKCKLYGSEAVNLDDIDFFEYYVHQNRIQGKKAFATSFEQNEYAHFDDVELFRQQLFGSSSAIQSLLSSNHSLLGKTWVEKFQEFFEEGQIIVHLNELYEAAEAENNHEMADKHEQVWNLLLSILKEFLAVFADSKMKIGDFLDIILAGVRNANYRQIPANVDVVNVKDYSLVEPRTNKYVYAIGLSQSNFPRTKVNSTLISDDERAEINENASEGQFIEQLDVVNYQTSTFTNLSLMNAATKELILSVPKIVENAQDDISPVIQLILEHSEPQIRKKIHSSNADETLVHIGNARSVISSIGKIERQMNESQEEAKHSAFWSSIFRLLTKNNSDFKQILLNLDKDISTVNLSAETVNKVYNGHIYASVSSFERFYNCEYQYFLESTLKLETFEEIDINSKVVGNFFHAIFEKLLIQKDLTSANFDAHLDAVIADVNKEYRHYFTQGPSAQFTWENLEEIVYQTAVMLKKNVANPHLTTKMTESSFGLKNSELGEFVIDDVHLRGRIDRIDETDNESLGAIDYKSSAHRFNLQSAFDGTSLQFLTYLDVLKQTFADQKLWGALYLQFQNSPVELAKINQLSEITKELEKAMAYEGLLLAESSADLKEIDGITINKNNVYQPEEFEKLLEINRQHYQRAAHRLKEGKIAINPIMQRSEGIDKSGNVRGCRYCPLKSICRFEANVHMNDYTREIGQKTAKKLKEELSGKVKD